MLLSTYAKLRSQNCTHPVILDSEDTDVYVQAAYVSQNIQGQLFIKRKGNYINCQTLLNEEVSKVIIAAHVISGSDHTSGFYGHGKKSVMKRSSLMQKLEIYYPK